MNEQIRIVELDASSLSRVVEIHLRAFPNFYLTELGAPFLGAYYRTVIECEQGVVLGAFSGETTVGFVSGYLDPSGFHAFMRSHRRRFIVPLLRALIAKPWLVRRTLYNVQENRRLIAAVPKKARSAELSSIAVMTDVSECGIGRNLVAAFIGRVANMGADEVRLTTDSDNNDAVNRFYHRLGFAHVETLAAGPGRTKNLYRYGIESSETAMEEISPDNMNG